LFIPTFAIEKVYSMRLYIYFQSTRQKRKNSMG